MAKVLVTGAGGYVGSEMVEYLLGKGHQVVAYDRYFFGDVFEDLLSNPNLSVIKKDIRNMDAGDLEGVDAVIDLASISNDPSSELMPKITTDINHDGAVHVAKTAKAAGVKKLIFSSSCSMYGTGEGILTETSPLSPVSTYAKCKIAAENDIIGLADDSFSVTFMRNATVYGLSKRRMRFDLIINIMTLHAWKNGKVFIMGGGKQWRPLLHIMDMVKAFELVLNEEDTSKINKEAFNVGSSEQNYQVYQVANMVKKFFPGLILETTPDDPDPRTYHVNFDKIKNVLGFTPSKTPQDGIVEIKEALENFQITDDLRTRTVDYYKYLIEADKVLQKIKLGGELF